MSQMKLVHPRSMSAREMKAYKFCLISSSLRVTRDETIAAIIDNISSMEDGAGFIRQNFQVPNFGGADLLACDRSGRPILIDVHDVLDAHRICRSFLKMDWVGANISILKYLFPKFRLDCEARCWHVAAEVSADAEALIRRIDAKNLEVFEHGCLELAGERWLVVQRREEFKNSQGEIREGETKPVSNPRTLLTAEEIDEFMSDAGEDEITSRCSL